MEDGLTGSSAQTQHFWLPLLVQKHGAGQILRPRQKQRDVCVTEVTADRETAIKPSSTQRDLLCFLVDRVFKYCKEKQQQQLLLRKVTCSSTDPAAHSGCSWWEEANYWESLCYSKRHKLVWLPAKLTNKPHFMSHRATMSSAPSIRTSVWRIITLKNKTTVRASTFNLQKTQRLQMSNYHQ